MQQVRALGRLDVISSAPRQPNGCRHFGPEHITGLRAYRHLAVAVGLVVARGTMQETRDLPFDEVIARVVALQVGLA